MYTPAEIIERLEAIDADLAKRQQLLEDAARGWFSAKRDREKAIATTFLTTDGTVAERKAHADRAHATDGAPEEAEYEAIRSVCRVLETRSTIGMALLKAHGRAGG